VQGGGLSHRNDVAYFDVAQAAAFLNTSERFIRRLVAERRIAYHKVGKYVRFSSVDLTAFVEAGRVDPIDVSGVWRDLRRAG
jgi:excisionase family DNA binding protein